MEDKKVLFFLPERAMNEATIYYVDIIKEALEKENYKIIKSNNFIDVRKFRKVFVMSAKWCFLVKIANPKADVITWFQGLGGEEALMSRGSRRDKIIWDFLEGFSMKYSWFRIYVSKRMKDYYVGKFNILDDNYFIMPCFNKDLNNDSFYFPCKYDEPSFVYAGSLDAWQCIEETLELYSLIEKKMPNANLTLLTKQTEYAKLLLEKYNIKNSKVKFVPLKELDNELQKFKYGFLIRKNHIVNNVSTPTKMNSYLANGIIPIYTDVIEDFNTNFNHESFICLKHKESINYWMDEIIAFDEEKEIDIKIYEKQVITLFNFYYSKDYYINEFSKNANILG